MGKTKGPTFLCCCLVMLLEKQVAWALGEKGQGYQLDHGGDSNHSKQVRPGALLRGEEGADEWMWSSDIARGPRRLGFPQKAPPPAPVWATPAKAEGGIGHGLTPAPVSGILHEVSGSCEGVTFKAALRRGVQGAKD